MTARKSEVMKKAAATAGVDLIISPPAETTLTDTHGLPRQETPLDAAFVTDAEMLNRIAFLEESERLYEKALANAVGELRREKAALKKATKARDMLHNHMTEAVYNLTPEPGFVVTGPVVQEVRIYLKRTLSSVDAPSAATSNGNEG